MKCTKSIRRKAIIETAQRGFTACQPMDKGVIGAKGKGALRPRQCGRNCHPQRRSVGPERKGQKLCFCLHPM